MVSKDKTSSLLSTGGQTKATPSPYIYGPTASGICICVCVCVGGCGCVWDGVQAVQMTAATFFHFPQGCEGVGRGEGGWQVSRNQRPSSDLPFSYTCESNNAFAIRQQWGRETSQTYIIVWPKRWDRIAVEMQCILYVQSRAPNPQRSNLPSLSDLWCYLDFTWFVFNVRVQRAKIEKNGAQ